MPNKKTIERKLRYFRHAATGVIYGWTKFLAKRTDMLACDVDGNLMCRADARLDTSDLSLRERIEGLHEKIEIIDLAARFDLGFEEKMEIEDMKRSFISALVEAGELDPTDDELDDRQRLGGDDDRGTTAADDDEPEPGPAVEESLRDLIAGIFTKSALLEMAADRDIQINPELEIADMKPLFIKQLIKTGELTAKEGDIVDDDEPGADEGADAADKTGDEGGAAEPPDPSADAASGTPDPAADGATKEVAGLREAIGAVRKKVDMVALAKEHGIVLEPDTKLKDMKPAVISILVDMGKIKAEEG